MPRAASIASSLALLACATGCTSLGGSAVRTGATRLPPYQGPVSLYFAKPPPPSATELGVVEVHARQSEATVENLVPLLVKKVAALGGDAAAIDHVVPRFEWISYPYTTTYTYACGFGAVCIGQSTTMLTDEVLFLTIQGRALRLSEATR